MARLTISNSDLLTSPAMSGGMIRCSCWTHGPRPAVAMGSGSGKTVERTYWRIGVSRIVRWNGTMSVGGRRLSVTSSVRWLSLLLLVCMTLMTSAAAASVTSDQPSVTAANRNINDWKEHLRNLKSYEIVVPQRIDEHGRPFPVHEHFATRKRRSAAADDDSGKNNPLPVVGDDVTMYRLSAFGWEMTLRLERESSFLPTGLVIQHMADNETWIGRDDLDSHRDCFHQGKVVDDPDSVVIVSTCNNMVGVIHTNNRQYFIEPLVTSDNTSSTPSSAIEHIIYQSDVIEERRHHNVKDDYQRRDEVSPEVAAGWHGNSNNNSSSSSSHHRQKRSHSKQRHVEVLVAVDVEMKRYHGHHLEHYILTLMAIVASIYRDSSIGNAINIVVVKVVVLETEQATRMISKNAASTLRHFCEWQHDVNIADDTDARHHDTAILLTRHDICRSSQKCDTLGLAELGTMCDPLRSCSIIKDSGLSAAFTVAHELGHVFSLRHDDECSPNKSEATYHVMAPTLDYETKPWSWSECSRDKITEFLDTGFGECLNDEPSQNLAYQYQFSDYPPTIDRRRSVSNNKYNSAVYQKLPGSAYTADEQCAQVFEHEIQRCPYMPVCIRLWCTNPENENAGCKTQHMPWADGTLCSNPGAKESMWCYRGKCVAKQILMPRDGGWGPWQPYQECSRTCGGGIKKAIRLCNSPEPENGGKFCIGRRVKYRSCSHMDCPAGSTDFREFQCSQFNGKHFNINGLTNDVKWVAKYSGINAKDRCKLFCRVSSSSAYYQLAERVSDGTKCGPDTSDVCVMGQCRRAGCDNRLGSSTKYDKCGICGGDNSQCHHITQEYSVPARMVYGYNVVTRIPKGATNIDIRQYAPNDNKDDDIYLALADASGYFSLNGNFIVSAFHKELHVSGIILEYTGSGTAVERINGTGMIYEDIIVHVLTVGDLKYPPVIKWQYTVRGNTDGQTVQRTSYTWSKTTKQWTPCSHLCQGVQSRKVVCLNEETGAIVSDRNCIDAGVRKPKDIVRNCHTNCRLSWQVASVGECQARCGESGIAVRDIRCAKVMLDHRRRAVYVSDEHCHQLSEPRLPLAVECVGACVSTRWLYGAWTECSKMCGSGDQQRSAECVDYVGRRVAENECLHENRVVSQKCNVDPCPAWTEGEWTGCSVTCGRGWRYRAVHCKYRDSTVVKSYCNPLEEPDSRRECHAGSCPMWETGVWGPCSATCGKGVQSREVQCQLSSGVVVDDSACDASMRPRDLASCRVTSCVETTTATTTLLTTLPSTTVLQPAWPETAGMSWRTGGWTPCSVTCGQGVHERYVSCRDNNGLEADPIACNHLEPPPSYEYCTDRPCGLWRTGDWTPCSVTCGKEGHETRYVACVIQPDSSSPEQIVSESYCDPNTRPLGEQSCWPGACPRDDARPSSRHTGHDTSRNPSHNPSRNSGTSRDDVDEIVRDVTGAVSQWRAGTWSPCSSTCESGIQMRQIVCQSDTGTSTSCNPHDRPADSQSCNSGPCPRWNHGEWGSCDVTCNGGIQQRIVHCQLPSGEILPDANCLDFAPPRSQPCHLQPCPMSSNAHWKKGSWSPSSLSSPPQYLQAKQTNVDLIDPPLLVPCSVTCASGTKMRTVTCVNEAGEKVTNHQCKGKPPRTQANCRLASCPRWLSSPWSKCSATCGPGAKTRTVKCVTSGGERVEPHLCLKDSPQPASVEPCQVKDCHPFHWAVGDWSTCSHSCGFGTQQRSVDCVESSTGHIVLDSRCTTDDKPRSQQDCSLTPCPTIWFTGDWTRCSMACGEGTQKRAVSCRAIAREGWMLPGHLGNAACNQTERPASDRSCNYGDCSQPYFWHFAPWSTCSKTCGFGQVQRQVFCVDKNGRRQHDSYCESKTPPEIHRMCYDNPCYSTSCKELQQNSAVRSDGEFNLMVDSRLVQVYCSGMSGSNPKEYLTLVAGESDNFSEVFSKRLLKPNMCAGNSTKPPTQCVDCYRKDMYQRSGRTTFSRVRFNITSLLIITNDFAFSVTSGATPVPFGSAGDCYSSTKQCPQGKFRVQLSGTDFMVDPNVQWESVGKRTVQDIHMSPDRQTVEGTCGGHCGHCAPNSDKFLQLRLLT